MSKFKLSVLTLAIAAAGFAPGLSAAQASAAMQDTAPAAEQDQATKKQPTKEEIEVIEVRSYSGSLIKSLNMKRFNDTVSETISADDLGALPDVSMADALTRLPGISAVRTGGQAAEINIRGMSGGFVFSTLNGREQVSTSGSRSIEFDQYPSELISSAAVYKSPKASLIEGGVAGTVELETASPLRNAEQHTFMVNARGMFNDRADEVPDGKEMGDRFSFSYQGKFADDTLGLALGYARLFQPSVATQFIGLAYNANKDVDGIKETDPNEFISEGFEIQHKGGEEVRNGYMASLEWVPHDAFKLKGDAFISKFDSKAFARGYRVKLGGASAAVGNPVLNGNSVIGGTFNRTSSSFTRVELVNDDNQDFDQVQSYGINADWDVSENFNLNFDVSHSSAESDFRNGLLWSLVAQDATVANPVFDSNVSISYLLNGLNLPDVGFNQAAAFSDINRVMVSKYGIYPFENKDELNAVRLDGSYKLDMPVLASFEVGVRYSEREYANDRSVYEFGNDGAFSNLQKPLRLTQDMVKVIDFKGDFSYFPSYLAIDLDKALAAWFPNGIPQPVKTWGTGTPGVLPDQFVAGGPQTGWSMLQSGKVFEDVLSAYLMANIDTDVFNIPLTGNFGVRMVETKQLATALQDVKGDPKLGAQNITDDAGLINGQYAPSILGETYRDYLPQLNLNFRLTDDDQLRFAAAKVMSRPPINRLASDTSTSISDDGIISGSSSNNPYLRPFYADQYDISYEHYFTETEGAFVAALFYKDIKSFISTYTTPEFDFAAAGFFVPEYREDPVTGVRTELKNGDYTTAVNNDKGGYIRGAEVAYTQIFKFLPGIWQGLGVSGSYSYTESEIQQPTNLGGDSIEISLPGLSENVFTGTLFWEYDNFEARLSARFRDPFVSEQVAVNEQIVNYDGETVLDFQTSYQVTDNFGVLFQVNNLTDEPTKSYFGDELQTGTIQFFGRQYFFGVTYSM
ncbi:TonB-dependent receptor [Rheinheimera riviphila]|uniref:TonB-dependent receptor n=1 Tax=Rheinheimera riviphila TaxID=1834037 RepID=A0A437QBH2_9GAMM|nr:TonB-dependent receptor [Rheinheimera riviphila]RVU31861.1 TonB-dependent receptor [Rheinheimera riviphila]